MQRHHFNLSPFGEFICGISTPVIHLCKSQITCTDHYYHTILFLGNNRTELNLSVLCCIATSKRILSKSVHLSLARRRLPALHDRHSHTRCIYTIAHTNSALAHVFVRGHAGLFFSNAAELQIFGVQKRFLFRCISATVP